VKRVDEVSPLLYESLLSGRFIPRITVYFIHITDTSSQGLYTGWASMIVEYNNCSITAVRPWTGNVLDPIGGSFGHLEEISFDSAKATWTARSGAGESPITVSFDIEAGRVE
jgi:type VI protein secretion system component Hcp